VFCNQKTADKKDIDWLLNVYTLDGLWAVAASKSDEYAPVGPVAAGSKNIAGLPFG